MTEYEIGKLRENVELIKTYLLELLQERFEALPDAHRGAWLGQVAQLRNECRMEMSEWPEITDFDQKYGRVAAREAFYDQLYKKYGGLD